MNVNHLNNNNALSRLAYSILCNIQLVYLNIIMYIIYIIYIYIYIYIYNLLYIINAELLL